MTEKNYTTYWTCDGKRIDDFAEVERMVNDGHVVAEVSAAIQRDQALQSALIEKWYREAVERYNRQVAEQNFKTSAKGQKSEALRRAQVSPGGWVSGQPDFAAELDAFGPEATDVFK